MQNSDDSSTMLSTNKYNKVSNKYKRNIPILPIKQWLEHYYQEALREDKRQIIDQGNKAENLQGEEIAIANEKAIKQLKMYKHLFVCALYFQNKNKILTPFFVMNNI